MSARTTLKKVEEPTSSVMEILSSEISSIAKEIEDLPTTGFNEITHEQMVWMQQIDFCSQRLSEVSKLIRYLSLLEESTQENLPQAMRDQSNLEHVKRLFG